ncbi:Phenylacetate 2-hydroxylase [Cyberlindnera fabianii]|uniref:Phenylacetate 2-hydroxylase n=1 Tax=Cyberlindnera fabianii TaxID=36022 RepID=A0A1V2L8W6_CYBFA|nr:Phenylacetate 2-hydroxylase [Cyberlindnera fabianii]
MSLAYLVYSYLFLFILIYYYLLHYTHNRSISSVVLHSFYAAILALFSWLLLDWAGVVGPRRIKNIPSVPGLPFIGNLYQVNNNPARQYMKWRDTYGDVFQMRLGSRIVVVANSYESVKELWIKNASANNSRPVLYTFHNIVSKTKGFTVGTTPWSSDYKVMKKIIATSLNKKNVDNFSDFISNECTLLLRRIDNEVQTSLLLTDEEDIDVFKLLQGYVLRVSLYITYGYLVKVEHTDKCKLFDEITHVENRIVRLRGHSSNKQDYLPILRFFHFNKKTDAAKDYRRRRDVYMAKFYDGLLDKIAKDEDFKDAIASRVLRGSPEYPKGVSADQLNSVCLTMVSAGLDNTPLMLNHVLGHLSCPINNYGKRLQDIAYSHLMTTYGSMGEAYRQCAFDFECHYIQALVKEGLRFFSVLPTGLPRATTREIIYKDAVIPSGTILFMNAFAANHDTRQFENPYCFFPERYLGEDLRLTSGEKPDNFTFGAGTRVCGGLHLSYKEMYVMLSRFILLYHIEPATDEQFQMQLDPFEMNSEPGSVAFEPRPFKFVLRYRDQEMFERLVGSQ